MKFLENLFARRPRILNQLHKLHLVHPITQTDAQELAALERYARGRSIAVEIGSLHGVSAGRIAGALAPDGLLFCIDPWAMANGRKNPNLSICERHLTRMGVKNRVRLIRQTSAGAAQEIPEEIHFAFVDGDHSWSGIQQDWNVLAERITDGGIVCLHDTAVPGPTLQATHDSCRFYDLVISQDTNFRLQETVHSMRILQRVAV